GVIYQYKIGKKVYVGKTYMQERKRQAKHKFEAFTLNKPTPFSRAIRKYGWETAIAGYSVIEIIKAETVDELNAKLIEREAFWIKEKNSLVPNGYNIYSHGTKVPPHTKNKEEIYGRVSKALKGKYMNCPETSHRVYCVEQKKWYPSESEAERQNNLARSTVSKAAQGINVCAGGLHWVYNENDIPRENKIKASRKPIICIETGKIYPSIYAVAKELYGDKAMAKKSAIQNALRYNRKTSGLTFRYVNPVLSETEV
ncbi:MAG: hypothetical protein NC299_15790, partial [Lachnospiraceae bacterium]|nr:hypothetical protein [Lachnospiraceae bacterium]